MTLFPDPQPPSLPAGIDLHCADAATLPELMAGEAADLMIADPPWVYARAIDAERESGTERVGYTCLPIATIRAHLSAIRAARLALWITWPLLPEWSPPDGYRLVTGGAWSKSEAGDRGHYGPGYHWAGCSEPVLIYSGVANAPNDRAIALRNAWVEPPGEHSAKPTAWMAAMIRRWVRPGGLVVDPYAGLGSVAAAVIGAGGGRRYIGTEIDPVRHRRALGLLAQARGLPIPPPAPVEPLETEAQRLDREEYEARKARKVHPRPTNHTVGTEYVPKGEG